MCILNTVRETMRCNTEAKDTPNKLFANRLAKIPTDKRCSFALMRIGKEARNTTCTTSLQESFGNQARNLCT